MSRPASRSSSPRRPPTASTSSSSSSPPSRSPRPSPTRASRSPPRSPSLDGRAATSSRKGVPTGTQPPGEPQEQLDESAVQAEQGDQDEQDDEPSPAPSQPVPGSSTYPTYYPPWFRQPPNPDPVYLHAPVLTEYLEANFVPSVVPQPDEYQAKEQARQFLEKLADQVSPGAKLLPFGSMANGFALKNSDMDLCCFLGKDAPVRAPSELVDLLGSLIERETNFYVKMLPRARIPIIKLTMPPTPTVPAGMACDIGFENRLALENTRLLLTYAMVDPRLRTLVLFLKVWTKRRKINNPYRGTLSSYGYVLLVIHFLAHVKQPPVVPNLQRLPLPTTIPLEDLTYEGHDISFFDDLDLLPTVFQALNVESTGELLIDFFQYFASTYDYASSVISIRSEAGILKKEEKGWHAAVEFDPEMPIRDLHMLCIEDPFALDYNVARTVTGDGLYTIQGEFARAHRILTSPTTRTPTQAEQVTAIINELCAEREEYLLMQPPADSQPTPSQPYPSHPPQPHQLPHHHQHPPIHAPLAASPSQPQPHPSPSHFNGPKSPRRRSVPSSHPRPPPPSAHHLHQHPHASAALASHQYGVVPAQPSPRDQTLWHAAMGNGGPALGKGDHAGGPYGHGDILDVQRNGPQPPAVPHRRPFQPSPSYPRPPVSHYHLSPSPAGTVTPSTGSSSPAASTTGSTLDRRQSWDGSAERNSMGTSSSESASGITVEKRSNAAGPMTTTAPQGPYDLHRFFQNPPSSSMSDVGAPTGPTPHPRTTVSLTAPPSPDLAPSAYFSGHSYGHGGPPHPGRAPYRYASSGYPGAHHGPRHATSVPRNAHGPHPAYASPYAGAQSPVYPLNSSTSSTSSHASYSSYPVSSVPTAPAPAPIFPAEDRERIARASSITFGNFPELLPLPSYAHYHASGGSAAYLSGSGGWGVQPYGMGGPGGEGRAHGYEPRRRVRQSFGLSGDETEDVAEEDEDGYSVAADGTADYGVLDDGDVDERGRRCGSGSILSSYAGGVPPLHHLNGVTDGVPVDHRQSRQRGRSVPHTRMGPDGRESILFGAIEVTLPKPEDVEAAEREEVDKEQAAEEPRSNEGHEERTDDTRMRDNDDEEHVAEPNVAEAVEAEDEMEQEVANLGPSPPSEDVVEGPTTDDIPPKAIEVIPTLTTSPPTPARTPVATVRAPLPSYASRPLSPLFNSTTISTPIPPYEPDDLDRTPRPSSPLRLPDVDDEPDLNGVPFASPPSSSKASSPIDSPRSFINGLASLSLDSNTSATTPAAPVRSPKAAKRARQNQRRKESAANSAKASPTGSPKVVESTEP
ncbi:hypothetical protein JCM10212_000178 [Sporobolomyces blumeae]